MKRFTRIRLAFCFFISGATTLALEVVWSKELSYILGNTYYAIATVVAAFMTGLAIGSALAGRYGSKVKYPIKAYALMEFVIAICGICSIWVLRSTPPLFDALYSWIGTSQLTFLSVRFLFVFLLMLIPVTLMGMTLPVVVGASSRGKKYFDFDAGLFYGLNTLGAVVGTLIAGFFLMQAFGLAKACTIIGVTDFIIGTYAVYLHMKSLDIAAKSKIHAALNRQTSRQKGFTQTQKIIGIVFLLSGFFSLVYEISWFRLLVSVLGPSVHSFSMMLAIFLIGIGLGSTTGAKITGEISLKNALIAMAGLETFIGLGTLLTIPFYDLLPEFYVRLFVELADSKPNLVYILIQSLITAIVVLPGTFIMGLIFPITIKAYLASSKDRETPEATVGKLYLFNTLGAIAGSLIAGFYLVPTLGFYNVILLASFGSVLLGCILVVAGVKSSRPYFKAQWIAGSLATSLSIILAVPEPDARELNSGLWYKMSSKKRTHYILHERDKDKEKELQPIYYKDGINTAVSILPDISGYIALMVSNKPVASSGLQDQIHLYFIGHLPALFTKNLKDVAIVGLGAGVSAGAVLKHPSVESVDIIEIEQGVVEASEYFFNINNNPLKDPKTNLIIEDGRIHLTYTGKKYDLISTDPISPISAGAANLYTADYFAIVSQRLKPQGTFSQWIPMSDMSEKSFKSILAAISKNFAYTLVFLDEFDAIIISSHQRFDISWKDFARRFNEPAVYEDFNSFKINSPFALLAFLYGGPNSVKDYVRNAEVINSDDNVWLERQMPVDLYTNRGRSVSNDLISKWSNSRFNTLIDLMPDLPVYDVVQTFVGNSDLNYYRPLYIKNWMTNWYFPTYKALMVHFNQKHDQQMLGNIKKWQMELLNNLRELRVEQRKLNLELTGKEKTYGLAKLYALAGEKAEKEGHCEQAEKFYKSSIDIPRSPTHYQTVLKLARLLKKQSRLDDALGYLGTLKNYYPAKSAAYAEIIKIYQASGDSAAANKTLKTGLFLVPKAKAKELALLGENN